MHTSKEVHQYYGHTDDQRQHSISSGMIYEVRLHTASGLTQIQYES